MRPILAYSSTALPPEADEGQVFINVTTEEQFIYRQGKWQPCLVPLPVHTPSTPEKVLSEPPTPKEEEATPKKTSSKKKKETK